jgi:hypothetical protein
VLHYKPNRSLYPNDRPDFYGKESADWLVYPWDPDSALTLSSSAKR